MQDTLHISIVVYFKEITKFNYSINIKADKNPLNATIGKMMQE